MSKCSLKLKLIQLYFLYVKNDSVFYFEGGGVWGEKLPRVADALCAPLLWLKADPGPRGIGCQLLSHWLRACVSQLVAPPIVPPMALEVGVKFEEV